MLWDRLLQSYVCDRLLTSEHGRPLFCVLYNGGLLWDVHREGSAVRPVQEVEQPRVLRWIPPGLSSWVLLPWNSVPLGRADARWIRVRLKFTVHQWQLCTSYRTVVQHLHDTVDEYRCPIQPSILQVCGWGVVWTEHPLAGPLLWKQWSEHRML